MTAAAAPLTIEAAPDVLTVPELARLLRCHKDAAYRLVADGEIYAARIGRSLRVPKSAVVDFIEGRQQMSRQVRVV